MVEKDELREERRTGRGKEESGRLWTLGWILC